MSVAQFPPKPTLTTVVATATSANTTYRTPADLSPGFYRVSCVSTSVATVWFYSRDGAAITKAVTVSGTVTVNLGTRIGSIVFVVNTGTNINIEVDRIGAPLAAGVSGTVDTITSSGTYSQTGEALVFLVAGGTGGNAGFISASTVGGGAGGGSGGVLFDQIYIGAPVSVTIGSGGAGGATQGATGGTGGTTSFGSLSVTNAAGVAGGAGSTIGTAGNGASTTANAGYPVNSGITGGGGGGAGRGTSGAVGTPGIGGGATGAFGKGGDGGSSGVNGGAGTGYGAGGGGGGSSNTTFGVGGTGAPGVVYVLRF